MFSPRLGCSSISFRKLSLQQALAVVCAAGFEEIDLGALPGVCDHVPYALDDEAVARVRAEVVASGVKVRSVNGDIGDLNAVLNYSQRADRAAHLDQLLRLTAEVGAEALVLPCGGLSHNPVRSLGEDLEAVANELKSASAAAARYGLQLWTESLHYFRLCWNIERAGRLAEHLTGSGVGLVMDLSHIAASGSDPTVFVNSFGDRIRHVHLRDAVPGNINLSIGNGQVDFRAAIAALQEVGYAGHFSLELETHDIDDSERSAAAVYAGQLISSLLSTPGN